MKTRRLSSPLLAAVFAVACTGSPTATRPITELPRQLTAAELGVIAASNTFAFGLLREVNRAHADSNVFLSPLSASMALGMTVNGAAGTTLDSMRAALGFGQMPLADMNASYQSIIALLRGLDPNVDFRIANSIWYRQGFPFEASFLDLGRRYFDARIEALDFADPGAPGVINGWVSDNTGGRIPTIVDQIPADAVMYLINAIYFKGAWTVRFDPADTRDGPFFAPGVSTPSARYMSLRDTLRYYEDDSLQAVDLAYGGGPFAMTVVLPREGGDVNALIAGLTASRWVDLTGRFSAREVDLYLPKFRLTWEDLLNEPLGALGMGIAFRPGEADFTGMSRQRGRELFISKVKQKTFVDVNEEGTEAAAVTAVEIGITSAGPERPVMRVDRPFLFAIRERYSGTLLFVGKIVRPPQG